MREINRQESYTEYFVVAHAQVPADLILPSPTPAPFDPKAYLRELLGNDKDFAILDKIATCESKWRMVWNSRHEERPSYFTAYGYFQITKGTATLLGPGLDRFDPQQQIEIAVKIYRANGTKDWNESAKCWSKVR